MSELIPSCSWEDFCKIVEAGRLSELKSCEILFPEHKCNVIIFHGDVFAIDFARTQSAYLAQKTNIELGKEPEVLLAEIESRVSSGSYDCSYCGKQFDWKIALEGHKQSHKENVLV